MDNYKNGASGHYKPETIEYAGANGASTTGAYEAKPTFGRKLLNHYKRFWWAHLLQFCIGTLIVTLCLIYVGFPNIAQSQLNKATLELSSQVVTNPTPNSVQVNMVTIARSNSSYHPVLDEFKAALFLENTMPDIKPFAHLMIPTNKAGKKTTITLDQIMKIENMEQFIAYNTLVTASEEYRVAIRGTVKLHLPVLPSTDVQFNKVVTSKGLNKMQGLAIRDMKLTLKPDAQGANMRGTAYIPNPSPMTLYLGNITQNLYVDGKLIGYSYLDDVTLRPGDNLYPIRSNTDQAAVITMITSKYKNAILPMDVVGNASVVNGVVLPYYSQALKNVPIRISLDVGPALKDLGFQLPPGGL